MLASSPSLTILSRYLCGFALVLAVFVGSTAQLGLEPAGAQGPIFAQVTPLEDETEEAPGLGVIVGTPEAGPEPEDAGDRGGVAQLGLAIVLFGAIGFIATRVIKGARAVGAP